jgi:REP element-mobilizing transposase RayT
MSEASIGELESLAYVVMPDHLHWLVQLCDDADLSRCVQRVKSCSARVVNASRGFRGRFWQPGFHDHALRQEEDLVNVARYVIANPLRAGLVRSVRDYPLWDAVWV